MTGKRHNTPSGSGGSASATLETLPETLMIEVLQKLDLESLCSTACVSRALYSSASSVLASLSSLDLSAFSPDERTLDVILGKLTGIKSLMLDCLRLSDSSVIKVLGPHIQELILLKGYSLSHHVLTSIGHRCPKLRVLCLELIWLECPKTLRQNIAKMFKGFTVLESLAVKLRQTDWHIYDLLDFEFIVPKTLRNLKLKPVDEQNFIHFIQKAKDDENFREPLTSISAPIHQSHPHFLLQNLSLVLNVISDELVITIANFLPHLVELDLEDRPYPEPTMPRDLTNYGLQALGSCQHLTGLSIVRNRQSCQASFRRINDMGMFLLSESCQGLKLVTLGGFSTVTDAGFSSILRSCQSLKKFEIRNASLLSDLTFHDMRDAACSLIELRILSCRLITSEAFTQLTSFKVLEVLDTSGCRSIGDTCLSNVFGLQTLTVLNISGAADVTDNGLLILGDADLPLMRLCLRGCTRITEKGIEHLFRGGGRICKTLSSLDLGHMPGISDTAISIIASAGEAITELCIRRCFFVTDASLKILTLRRMFQDENRLLQKLDLFECARLSSESMALLQDHAFRALRWLGAGRTSLSRESDCFAQICRKRPRLTVCYDGCEMGCHDGWHFHTSYA